jgi:hypothetical protein
VIFTQFTRIRKTANTIEVLLLRGGPWKESALCNVAPGQPASGGPAKFRPTAGRGRPGIGGEGALGPRGPIPVLGCGGERVGASGQAWWPPRPVHRRWGSMQGGLGRLASFGGCKGRWGNAWFSA